jgi:4-hydroxy-4-methyl-2-oxoglutarate aldolase
MDTIVEGFRDLPTALISDALDRLRMPGSALGIAPLQPNQRMIGRAFTVRYVPAGVPVGTVGDYIDDLPPGTVIVLDNQGRLYGTVWGDILTSLAHKNGIAGTAIWGVCRDVATALRLNYPIYSAGRFMRTGKDRVEVADMQVPVALGDVQVRPNDIVIGNEDGIVIVPAAEAERVLETAQAIAAREETILNAVLAGTKLRDARAAQGYHTLQRSETPA